MPRMRTKENAAEIRQIGNTISARRDGDFIRRTSMSDKRCHVNERLHTEFANSGRMAGIGISYDHYDEESGYRPKPIDRGFVRFPHDHCDPERLSGEVRVIKRGG